MDVWASGTWPSTSGGTWPPVFLKVDHIVLDPAEARRFSFSKRESLHKGGRIKDGTRVAVLNQKATWGYGKDTDAQVNMATPTGGGLGLRKGDVVTLRGTE